MAIGAAKYTETPGYFQNPALLRDCSAWGVQPIYYAAQGNLLPEPIVSHLPHLYTSRADQPVVSAWSWPDSCSRSIRQMLLVCYAADILCRRSC